MLHYIMFILISWKTLEHYTHCSMVQGQLYPQVLDMLNWSTHVKVCISTLNYKFFLHKLFTFSSLLWVLFTKWWYRLLVVHNHWFIYRWLDWWYCFFYHSHGCCTRSLCSYIFIIIGWSMCRCSLCYTQEDMP